MQEKPNQTAVETDETGSAHNTQTFDAQEPSNISVRPAENGLYDTLISVLDAMETQRQQK